MKNWIFVFGVLGCFFYSSLPAESRGMGRFLGSMVARGATSAAVSFRDIVVLGLYVCDKDLFV